MKTKAVPEAQKKLLAGSGQVFPNIERLQRQVLDRWYRSKETKKWDKAEAAATRAQATPPFEE